MYFSIKFLLKNINCIYNSLFCCNHTCYCVNMDSVTSASRNITPVSRYYPRHQSRSLMYIRALIQRNFTELAEVVLIGIFWSYSLVLFLFLKIFIYCIFWSLGNQYNVESLSLLSSSNTPNFAAIWHWCLAMPLVNHIMLSGVSSAKFLLRGDYVTYILQTLAALSALTQTFAEITGRKPCFICLNLSLCERAPKLLQ